MKIEKRELLQKFADFCLTFQIPEKAGFNMEIYGNIPVKEITPEDDYCDIICCAWGWYVLINNLSHVWLKSSIRKGVYLKCNIPPFPSWVQDNTVYCVAATFLKEIGKRASRV